MEERMGHTGIEHIFTCIDIDKHTYIYLYRESFSYTNYTDMFIIGNSLSSSLMLKVNFSFILQVV